MTAKGIGVTPFSSIQDEYSLVVRDIEKELQPAAKAYNLGILPYFPLASGLLTGKYAASGDAPAGTRFALVPRLRDRYVNEKNIGIVEKLKAFATDRGHSMRAARFLRPASRPQVSSVIAGGDQARAGRAERQGRGVEDDAGRDSPRSTGSRWGISDGKAVIASEAKQSSAREARKIKSAASAANSANFYARLPARSWIASP